MVMIRKPKRGLFITGTDTDVGKSYVAAMIAQTLHSQGHRVGVYKPVASGCEDIQGNIVSGDAVALWEAAGRPGSLEQVCPQRFMAPLAPHLAARAEGQTVDPTLLLTGIEAWHDQCDLIIVEGVGGLLSPLSDDVYVADLACDLGYPLIVVASNKLGVINQTLQTLLTAAAYGEGLDVAGVVLCDTRGDTTGDTTGDTRDVSLESNPCELVERCASPLLAHVGHMANSFDPPVDWIAVMDSSR